MKTQTLIKKYQKYERLAEVAHRMECYKMAKKWSQLSSQTLEEIRRNLEITTQETAATEANRDEQIIQAIRELDSQYNTDNFLPIYYLREKLNLTKEAFDREIYRLQREDKIELSSLQESMIYTRKQISAGLGEMSRPLFFISIV